MRQEDLLQLWYLALGEPFGLLLEVSDLGQARQGLYAARAKAAEPVLDDLQLRAGAEPGLLAIVHASVLPERPRGLITQGPTLADLEL